MSDDELDTALVEKAAEAICQRGDGVPLSEQGEFVQREYRDYARAALAAVDLPAARAEAERAGRVKALQGFAYFLDGAASAEEDNSAEQELFVWAAEHARDLAAEVESGVTAQERGE